MFFFGLRPETGTTTATIVEYDNRVVSDGEFVYQNDGAIVQDAQRHVNYTQANAGASIAQPSRYNTLSQGDREINLATTSRQLTIKRL